MRTLDAAEFITSNEENDIENGISEQCLHNAIKILKQKRQNQLNVSFGRTFYAENLVSISILKLYIYIYIYIKLS